MRAVRILVITVLFAAALPNAYGQDFHRTYEDFVKKARNAHRNFSDSLNAEFARTISSNWEQFLISEPESSVISPQPYSPTVAGGSDKSSGGALKALEIVDTLGCTVYQAGNVSHSASSSVSVRTVRFGFYDSIQEVKVPAAYGSFHPRGISESDVGEFWQKLGREDFTQILYECSYNRDNYGFNDWSVLEWVQALSCAIYPQNVNSERIIFEVFVLNQMGMMAKLARADDRLECLFASLQPVYARKYTVIDTYRYYLADAKSPVTVLFTYRSDFSGNTHPFDLRIRKPLVLGGEDSYVLTHFKSQVFACELDIPVNGSLKSFYEGYPQTTVNVYAQSAPDSRFSESLFLQLGEKLAALDVPGKINELLRFLHYDFSYKVDSDQFGYEKQFFCEENFIYEANDCEDRAILFSFLVRRLTGKKVILLEYDDHIATAVRFDEGCDGHYVNLEDGRYFICDPTFIGATAGMCMPKYVDKKARIYVI